MDDLLPMILLIIIVCLSVFGTFCLFESFGVDRVPAGIHQRAVDNGFAHYDTMTANFVWDDTRVQMVVGR